MNENLNALGRALNRVSPTNDLLTPLDEWRKRRNEVYIIMLAKVSCHIEPALWQAMLVETESQIKEGKNHVYR